MGIFAEKRDKIAARIVELTERIATDTAKKKELEEKLKEANRLAMAEQFNCKPRELDDIINSEHTLLEKLRASGLSDSDLLALAGIPADDNGSKETGDNCKSEESDNADSSDCNADDDSRTEDSVHADSSDSNADDDSADDDDDIRFYDTQDSDEDDEPDDENA